MNNFSIKNLIDKFNQCRSSLQDCILKIDTFENYNWCVYFRLGRIVWVTGGQHRFRRWQRLIDCYLPNLNYNQIEISGQIDPNLCEYVLIKTLRKNQQLSREAAIKIIDRTITEALFEILQSESRISQANFQPCEYTDSSPLKEALVYVNPNEILQKVQNRYNNWLKSGLVSFSPNLALVLLKPELLKSLTDPGTYEKICYLVDGERTIRDLEIITKQDILTLGTSFLPYIQKNIIGFRKLGDLSNPIEAIIQRSQQKNINLPRSKSTSTSAKNSETRSKPVILCVDDSPKVCQIMDEILTEGGYKFIGVNDSLAVLPILIENKPDLIFLDLVMPVANGYEICAQIRKISTFKDTPVVILTGNDGIVDRVRAKMVGASEFLTKPVESEKVLGVVSRYIKQKNNNIVANPTTLQVQT